MHVLASSGEDAAILGLHTHQAQRERGWLVGPLPTPHLPTLLSHLPIPIWDYNILQLIMGGKGRPYNVPTSFYFLWNADTSW